MKVKKLYYVGNPTHALLGPNGRPQKSRLLFGLSACSTWRDNLENVVSISWLSWIISVRGRNPPPVAY